LSRAFSRVFLLAIDAIDSYVHGTLHIVDNKNIINHCKS